MGTPKTNFLLAADTPSRNVLLVPLDDNNDDFFPRRQRTPPLVAVAATPLPLTIPTVVPIQVVMTVNIRIFRIRRKDDDDRRREEYLLLMLP